MQKNPACRVQEIGVICDREVRLTLPFNSHIGKGLHSIVTNCL